jgi:tetratricopeptide (TPR) repeat protein
MMNIKFISVTVLIITIAGNLCDASELKKGPFEVRFQSYKTYDGSRWYVAGADTTARPMLIHFWYPSREKNKTRSLTFKDYIDLIAIREDFRRNSTEVDQSSYNFVNAYSEFAKQKYGLDSSVTTQQILNSPVSSKCGVAIPKYISGFPLILYAPSNSKSSVQNHMICEFLASHGFMILSVGSAGPNSLKREAQQESTMAQVTDMEFILKYLEDSLDIEYASLGLLGFSSGGMATTILQMRNENVKAVFSMDGGHEYGSYLPLFQMEEFNLERTDVPYCLVVNNYENFSIYPFYNSVTTTEKKMFRMPYLDHNGFVSFWRFFDSCSTDQVSNKVGISYDYISDCALAFFNTYLKPGQSKNGNSGFSFSASEYIQPVIQDNTSISELCNMMITGDMDAVMMHLQENQNIYDSKEIEINILAKMFIDGYIEKSIQLLLYNVAHHPDSWQAHYNLGYAYKEKGELQLSSNELNRAHELNPENSDIVTLLHEVNE